MQPGGHVDSREPPATTAVRETAEETGIRGEHPDGRPRLVHVDVHEGGRGHLHLDLRYLLLAEVTTPAPPPGESPEVAWFGRAAAATVVDRSCRAAIDAALAALDRSAADLRPSTSTPRAWP